MTPDPIGLAGGINLYGYVLNDPVNLIDPEGLQFHTKFMQQVLKYTDKGIKSALKKLNKKIAQHEEALLDPAQKLAIKHHEHELRVFKEQLKIVESEAAKRGLMGAGFAAAMLGDGSEASGCPAAEDITEEEADERTSSWFDWIDLNLGVGHAY